MARPTLLIVDDHEDFRRSARTLLELEGFEAVGVAADGPSALLAVEALRPDVVLLDVQLPGMDGFEVVRELQARKNCTRVVLISSRDRTRVYRRAARCASNRLPGQERALRRCTPCARRLTLDG